MKKNINKVLILGFIAVIGFLVFYLYALPKMVTDIKLLEWFEKAVAKI